MSSNTKSASGNALASVLLNTVTILVGFVAQRVFIETLGKEVVGLNGLFSSITSILTLADLGFGAAIIFHLYKPLSRNDLAEVSAVLALYKRICFRVSCFISLAGIVMMPVVPYIVGEVKIDLNLYAIFSLFIVNAVFAYLMTYRRAILQADRKNYVISYVHLGAVIGVNILQIIALLYTGDYYIYLIISILIKVAESIILNLYINRRYRYLAEKTPNQLKESTRSSINKLVRGTIFHTGAGLVVSSIDNILISTLAGLAVLGLYVNYQLVLIAASTLISQIFYAITANLGNLLASGSKDRAYTAFKTVYLINSILSVLSALLILFLMQDFIKLWLGDQFLLDSTLVYILAFIFLLQSLRYGVLSLQLAGGVSYENRHIPVIEVLINLIASIILGTIWGVKGVLLGTVISTCFLHLFNHPKYAFVRLLGRSRREYIGNVLRVVMIFSVLAMLLNLVFNTLDVSDLVLGIIIKSVVTFVVVFTSFVIMFGRTDEYSFIVSKIKKII